MWIGTWSRKLQEMALESTYCLLGLGGKWNIWLKPLSCRLIYTSWESNPLLFSLSYGSKVSMCQGGWDRSECVQIYFSKQRGKKYGLPNRDFFNWYAPSCSRRTKSSSCTVVAAALEQIGSSALVFWGEFSSVWLLSNEERHGVFSNIPIMFLIALLTCRKSILGKVRTEQS